jgi:hypothetical protein
MDKAMWIQFGALLVAILSLVVQQTRTIFDERRKEKRTANKLKILYLCQNNNLTEEQIMDAYQKANPTESIDRTEIRKTIYEMLYDKTLVFTEGSYELASFTSRFKKIDPETVKK